MSKYEEFAFIYDSLMDDTPYDTWAEFILKRLNDMDNPQLICELGCGTGNMTIPLASAGYEVIGIDLSQHMLMVAREKALLQNVDILFLNQDMTEFELYGTVDMIVSVCDSLNYLATEEAMQKVFHLVANYLNPKGLFIFDLNTRYKFEHIYKNQTFTVVEEEYAYIWNNDFNPTTGSNMYDVTFFVRDEGDEYTRFEEFHEEYTHTSERISEMLEIANLELVAMYDEYTEMKAHNHSGRITYIARSRK